MITSPEIKQIVEALMKAHGEIKHVDKDAQNDHFKNSYSTLESVINATKDILLKYDIVTIQSPGMRTLTTRLQHKSGEFFQDTMELVLSKQDMQGVGSAITYARRQALTALCNIAQKDDDATAASKAQKKSRAVQDGASSSAPKKKKDNLPF